MERLTKRIGGYAHGAEGRSKKLTGNYCRGKFEATACIDKLAEYEDLEEQGLLLKLPCKVGDKAYSFSGEKVLTLIVDSFVIYADGIDARLVDGEGKYKFLKVDLDISDFGKTWFATQKEAEEALRRMNGTEG